MSAIAPNETSTSVSRLSDEDVYLFNEGTHDSLYEKLGGHLKYHVDGLRVDAVASMLYLDYGREDVTGLSPSPGWRIESALTPARLDALRKKKPPCGVH